MVTRSSIDCSLESIVAFTMVSQLARIVMTGCVKNVHDRLLKEFEVGKVVSYFQVKSKSTTSSGKYLVRAFSGINNKLKKPESSLEAKGLFVEWLAQLYEKEGAKIVDSQAFFLEIAKIFKEVKKSAAKKAAAAEKSPGGLPKAKPWDFIPPPQN